MEYCFKHCLKYNHIKRLLFQYLNDTLHVNVLVNNVEPKSAHTGLQHYKMSNYK